MELTLKIDLTKFATKDKPLRSSSLPMLLQCNLRSVLLFAREFEDSVGAAAHTGSAIHKAVEFWHQSFEYASSLSETKAQEKDYPKVDWSEVELYFRPYTNDPRNKDAKMLGKCESPFTFTLEEKETEPIVISGTIDQIRLDRGLNVVYDLKTGRTYGGKELLNVYAAQLAAYWLGAESLGHKIDRVGVISPYAYRSQKAVGLSPEGVFWFSPLTKQDCMHILSIVARKVRQIRTGVVDFAMGPHCQFCPAGGPATCIPIHAVKLG